MRRLIVTALALALTPAGPSNGHEHAPRILSPHNADTYSMKTFARFPRWRDLEGDVKAYAIYSYLADRRTGVYPLGRPAREGGEELYDLYAVRDPVKMLNVYTIGHCGTLGPTMAGILEGMGMGRSRSVFLPGFNHVAAEVLYDGRWHYLDLDLRAAFRRADGSLASMEDARADRSLWARPNTPLFFPLDSLDQVREAYEKETVEYRYGASTGGHTMDYVLRQGESFRRWWKPQGGRWDHHPSYHARPFPLGIIEKAPRGPKCKHESYSIHTYGNGRFVYKPDLTESSTDFHDGVHDFGNVRPGASGLTLAEAGEGYAVFEVRTPYVIVPLVGELETRDDDREASIVDVEAEGASISISLDGGLTWSDLEWTAGATDLTSLVSGRYGYLLKIVLRGEPETAIVRSLELSTWVQVHPASLPSLRKGRNRMRYVRDDHHGLSTHVMEIRPRGYDRDDVLKILLEPPPDFDPARTTRRAIGPFVVRVPAPPRSRIAWFSAGGSFRAAGADTRNRMEYAVDAPSDFRTFYMANLPAYHEYWHYNEDVEVLLSDPARTLYVRYVGDPGVNNLRIYAHCVRDEACRSSPVVITHGWREEGAARSQTVHLDGPGSYDVVTDAEPEDEFVEISVPSARPE